VKLGVYLGWHVLPWQELLELVQLAEELGYATALVDGDVSMLAAGSEADCLDGWTVTTALLALTSRIEIGSLRLVHHWNVAQLAQAAATAERLAPGRLRFQISIGDRPADARFGLAVRSVRERIAQLDETLDALRALWRGETVSRAGRHVRLDGARVRPSPPGGHIPIAVAARRPGMLEVVAAHADVWEINLPPVPARVAHAAEHLAQACEQHGRSEAKIARSMLLFTRMDLDRAPALAAFRRLNPWFRSVPDAELGPALILGEAPRCRERIAELAAELRLDYPVLDLSGLEAGAARRLLEALRPDE